MKSVFITLVFPILLTLLWACNSVEKKQPQSTSVRTAASADCNQYNSSSKEWATCANAVVLDQDNLGILVKINEALDQCQAADFVQGSPCDIFMSSVAKCGSSVACKMHAYVLFK